MIRRAHPFADMETDRPQKKDLERMEPRPPTPIETTTSTADKHFPLYQSADYGKIMAQAQEKSLFKSKTVWGLIATLLGGVCMALGWPADSFEFLSDGWQLADIGAVIAFVGFLWSQYGQRVARAALRTVTGRERKQ